jgi:hypothetical protein
VRVFDFAYLRQGFIVDSDKGVDVAVRDVLEHLG